MRPGWCGGMPCARCAPRSAHGRPVRDRPAGRPDGCGHTRCRARNGRDSRASIRDSPTTPRAPRGGPRAPRTRARGPTPPDSWPGAAGPIRRGRRGLVEVPHGERQVPLRCGPQSEVQGMRIAAELHADAGVRAGGQVARHHPRRASQIRPGRARHALIADGQQVRDTKRVDRAQGLRRGRGASARVPVGERASGHDPASLASVGTAGLVRTASQGCRSHGPSLAVVGVAGEHAGRPLGRARPRPRRLSERTCRCAEAGAGGVGGTSRYDANEHQLNRPGRHEMAQDRARIALGWQQWPGCSAPAASPENRPRCGPRHDARR